MLPQEKFKFRSSQMATQWLSATRTLVRLSEGAKVAFLIVFKSPLPPPLPSPTPCTVPVMRMEDYFMSNTDSLFLLFPSPPPQELSDTKAIGEGF